MKRRNADLLDFAFFCVLLLMVIPVVFGVALSVEVLGPILRDVWVWIGVR